VQPSELFTALGCFSTTARAASEGTLGSSRTVQINRVKSMVVHLVAVDVHRRGCRISALSEQTGAEEADVPVILSSKASPGVLVYTDEPPQKSDT
jgi:hypothetical protein